MKKLKAIFYLILATDFVLLTEERTPSMVRHRYMMSDRNFFDYVKLKIREL